MTLRRTSSQNLGAKPDCKSAFHHCLACVSPSWLCRVERVEEKQKAPKPSRSHAEDGEEEPWKETASREQERKKSSKRRNKPHGQLKKSRRSSRKNRGGDSPLPSVAEGQEELEEGEHEDVIAAVLQQVSPKGQQQQQQPARVPQNPLDQYALRTSHWPARAGLALIVRPVVGRMYHKVEDLDPEESPTRVRHSASCCASVLA